MKRCIKIKITGKVQGVLYRDFAKKHAERLHIEGTAQNAEEGSVIIHACGASEKLDEFLDLLYKGSPNSKVQDVVVEPLIQERDFRGVFRVIGVNAA